MKIELHEIAVKDVYDGYNDYGEDNGVVGYNGKLNIRPRYQRNFVYNLDQSKAVMNSVLHGFPLNVMY
ncbi:MAG: HNH endonuclease, partial [Limosilactobacillus coleohominis]|nr:HNH endonuclease [Limosilactobacillus coleohominis]